VVNVLADDPFSGHLFVFRGKRGGLLKILWHDGQGMCLFAKRLEKKLNPPGTTDQAEGDEQQPDTLNEPELQNKDSF